MGLPCLWALLCAIALLPTVPAWAKETSAYAQAVAAYQDRRLEEAFSYAQKAVKEEPEHPDAHLLLGELYYLRQELTKAKESWERVLELAPSRQDVWERLEKLKKEAQVERRLSRSDTYPFVVRFAAGSTPVDLGELRLLLRDTYRLVGQPFDYFPDHPITVILYPQANFDQVKGISHQLAGLYDGKIRLPLTQGLRATGELKRVLWHEYTHAIVHDLAKGNCPVWLNEGIAVLQEARIRPPDLSVVREAQKNGKLLSFQQLWEDEYTQEDLALHYAQAFLMAQYLVKRWGWAGITGLLKRLSQGYPMNDALRAEYRINPADLEKEFHRWLNRQL